MLYKRLLTFKPLHACVRIFGTSWSVEISTTSWNGTYRDKKGWWLGKDFEIENKNPNSFIVLVNMDDESNEFYIYQHDYLVKRACKIFNDYMNQPKKDGGKRKATSFWINLSDMNKKDKAALNNWEPIKKKLGIS